MKAVIIALGVLFCSAASAGPEPWMKKTNPETLHAAVFADPECLVSETEATEIVNGVLIRSRLRPGDLKTSNEEFGFLVEVSCIKRDQGFSIYRADVYFLRQLLGRILMEPSNYGTFGRADKKAMENVIRDSVERLVTDYLQANFDLTPE